MSKSICLALLAIAPASLAAQGLDPKAEWMQFLRQEGPSWRANWSTATGTPTVYGGRIRVADKLATVEAARPKAELILNRYAAMLGRGGSEFVETKATSIRHLHYFIYGQRFRGLEVRGGRADVRLTTSGHVVMFGSNAVSIPADFSTTPKVIAARARQLAEQAILGQAGKPGRKTRLVIHAQPFGDTPTLPKLAWEVEIDELPEELAAGKVFIDAVTGAQLEFENAIYTCTTCNKTRRRGGHTHRADRRLDRGIAARKLLEKAEQPAAPESTQMTISGTVMGWTNIGHSPLDPLVNVPMRNMFVTSSAGNTTTDANGQFSIPYSGTANVTVNVAMAGSHLASINPTAAPALTGSASLAPGVPGTVQIGTSTMPTTAWSQSTTYYFTEDVNEYVRSLVPNQPTAFARLDQMRAIVNIASSCNAFYNTNNQISFFSESATCNMTAYEGVIYHEWGHGLDDAFGGINRTDGLSEGWADVIAILRSEQPILGPDFFKSQTPNYVRIATNSRTYPAGGGTHQQGEVWMGWVWDVRSDLAGTLGTTVAQQITESIVIPTIVANATSLERQILEVFLLDDNDNDLRNGTPHYFELERACIKRNINYPPLATGILTHSPLQTSPDQLTARITVLEAMPISGSFTKAELIYDTGAGDVRVPMVQNGNVNEWVALIPGVLSPKVVNYYFEATHSTTKLLRLPEVGTYSYRIGKEDVFLFDDFETQNPGWTAGGSPSFSRGRPTGVSGTSWTIAWADPNGAFSGSNAWGNNLSGAYAPNSNSFLRSPILDLTGKFNVRLRFRRWLQVQEGKFDFARIRLNNDVVWENPWGQNILDNSWTEFDLPLTAADNNPSVQLEWSLQTDGGLELAGWNIDDVSVYTFNALPPPPVTLEIDPAMVDLGKQSTVTIKGTAGAPILLLVGATAGPIQIPGLPTIYVGPGFTAASARLNASGELSFNFTAPTSTGSTGQPVFVHVLERTNANTISGSNPGVILWGK